MSKTWVTPRDVYERFQRSKQTFHNWRARYGWKTDERGRVADEEVRATKLLSAPEILRRGITPVVLSEAVRTGRVVASRDGKYSENDLDILRTPTTPASSVRRDRQDAIDNYLEEGQRPCDLPDWFWETAEVPKFIAPMNVRGFYYGKAERRMGKAGRWIRATEKRDSEHVHPATSRFDWVPGRFVEGEVPAKYASQTDEYEIALFEWQQEWARRQPKLSSGRYAARGPSKTTRRRARRG